MAFTASDMKLVNAADGFNVYHYTTNDTLITVVGAGYFDLFHTQLNVGDLVFVSGDLGGTVATQHYVVSAASDTGVTVVASA